MGMMRQGGPNNRRPRGRHQNNNGGGERNGNTGGNPNMGGGGNRPRSAASLRHQTFDSNGPDVRVRGNAWQVHEKYQTLARDATSAGDRVMAENYLQHAEHYYRIIEAINEATAAEQRAQGRPPSGFGDQQPTVPSNYYGPDGTPTGGQPMTQPTDAQPQPMAPAEVVSKTPPASPFFTQEEAEETSGAPELLVANR